MYNSRVRAFSLYIYFETGNYMQISVIDIGSNTIKATVFEIKNGKCREVTSKTVHAKLSAHISDGYLSEKGIKTLSNAVKKLKKMSRKYSCKKKNIYAFATACVRSAENRDEILAFAEKDTKMKINLLSGEEEARLCFLGASAYENVSFDSECTATVRPSCGILADIGGGSCEYIPYEGKCPTSFTSLPIGALAMLKKFSSALSPTESDISEISAYVTSLLSENSNKIKMPEGGTVTVSGGSARAAANVISVLNNEGKPTFPHTVKIAEAENILSELVSGIHGEILEKLASERAETVKSGLAVLIASSKFLGCDSFTVVTGGARRGLAYTVTEKKAKKGRSQNEF